MSLYCLFIICKSVVLITVIMICRKVVIHAKNQLLHGKHWFVVFFCILCNWKLMSLCSSVVSDFVLYSWKFRNCHLVIYRFVS